MPIKPSKVKAIAEEMLDNKACDYCSDNNVDLAMDLLEICGLPPTLGNSEAYGDDRAEAYRLWKQGYRPAKAKNLKRGMTVACKNTDVFRLESVGDWFPVNVEEVKREIEYPGSVSVWHSGSHGRDDPAIMDEEDEVWVKRG